MAVIGMRIPRTSARESISRIAESAPPRSAVAVERALRIARIIERRKCPAPFVFPTEIGGIQFEWKGDERELNLEVLPEPCHLAFLEIVKGTPTQEGEITENAEGEINSLL
jgi:hypothetical protein